MASDHLPKVVKAEDLTVREGKLTWSSHGVSSEIDVGSLLFALKPPASAHQYIICGLKENNPESAATTFELVLLQTNSIPDQISSLHLVSQIPPHLRPSTDNLVDIVVSTKAGSGLALRFWQTVLHPLLRVAREELAQASPGTEAAELAGIQQESVLVTENAGSVPQFAQRLWASHGGQAHRDGGGKQSRTVILLSGDGGVVDILNSCEEGHDAQAPAASSPPQPLVCPLPLGTGNALFHSLHKPVASARPASSPLVLGLQTLFQGAPANLPTFRASFSAGSRVVVAAAEGQQHQAAADGGGATDTPPSCRRRGEQQARLVSERCRRGQLRLPRQHRARERHPGLPRPRPEAFRHGRTGAPAQVSPLHRPGRDPPARRSSSLVRACPARDARLRAGHAAVEPGAHFCHLARQPAPGREAAGCPLRPYRG
uniref:DAGKc domain-containing protein n=1 Tax=Bionectria ochroleuca TaxID=29856 RepID=A0A8H7TU25_BIOOC